MFALHSQSVFVANPLSRSNSNSNIKMYQMYSNTVRPFVYLLFNLDRGKITGLIHLRLCCINLVRVLHYYIHPICIIKLSDKIQCCKTCNIADATKKKKHSFLFLAKKGRNTRKQKYYYITLKKRTTSQNLLGPKGNQNLNQLMSKRRDLCLLRQAYLFHLRDRGNWNVKELKVALTCLQGWVSGLSNSCVIICRYHNGTHEVAH